MNCTVQHDDMNLGQAPEVIPTANQAAESAREKELACRQFCARIAASRVKAIGLRPVRAFEDGQRVRLDFRHGLVAVVLQGIFNESVWQWSYKVSPENGVDNCAVLEAMEWGLSRA